MFADELGCLHAVYQPIVDLADGGRLGYESLLRARRAAEDVAVDLRRPVVVGAVPTRISGSVGIALYPDDALTGDRLLAAADADMYRVKNAARATC